MKKKIIAIEITKKENINQVYMILDSFGYYNNSVSLTKLELNYIVLNLSPNKKQIWHVHNDQNFKIEMGNKYEFLTDIIFIEYSKIFKELI